MPPLRGAAGGALSGIIVGQVIADTTGLPLPGATVEIAGAPQAVTATTGEDGRYRIPTEAPQAVLVITKDGMTSVERVISVASDVGTVPVDARLVKVSEPVTVDDTGGVVHVPVPEGAPPVDTVTVEVGPGAPGAYRLTLLSAQGLPGLLPLGYSPLAAWDIRSDEVSSPSLTATVKGLAAGSGLHLVQYRPSIHAWTMAAPDVQPTEEGTLTIELPQLGTFALAVVDADANVVLADVGQTLNEAPYVAIPVNATSTGSAIPASLPPTGGTAIGSVLVSSETPLPSGTVVQARVRQRFTKTSGEPGSVEELVEDVVLFREPAPEGAALAARIPITPALTFSPSEIKEGVLEIEILAGRESVRGVTGGSQAATVEVDGARLSVPAGSLPEDTVIAVSPNDIWGLPTATGLTPLAQVDVTFAGQTLVSSAELSVEAPGDVAPGDSLLVVELVRVDGIQKVAVVALAKLVSGRIASEPYPGLPGIAEGGEYVFYRTAAPVGFVSGITSSTAGPVRSVVSTDTLPFIGHSRTSGTYVVATAPGSSTLSAAVPGTNLAGSVSGVPAEALQTTANVAIALTGTVTQATVTPSNGATGVATGTAVQITTTTALKASTVTADAIKLFKGNPDEAQSVALRFVLSASGQTLAAIPVAALDPGTTYTFQASGLADVFGGLISLEPTTFTTKPFTAPVFDTNAITFSFPDANGLVTVTVPPNDPPFLPPGTEILIINAGNGDVATFTVGNDGSVNGEIRASIDDRLLITVTAPDGSVTTYERSQYVNPETGETAVGPGGGTVTGPGGVELRIPEGATDKGVRLKISALALDELPKDADGNAQLPDLGEGVQFGTALKIESPDMPTYKKEVDLAFPLPAGLPDKPEDAFFYVVRRIERLGAEPVFAAIDIAFVEKDAAGVPQKVVTASAPHLGYQDSYGQMGEGGLLVASQVSLNFLMWSYNPALPQRSPLRAVTGMVQRSVATSDPTPRYQPVPGALVTVHIPNGEQIPGLAYSRPDGQFAVFHKYAGGTIEAKAQLGSESATATGFESPASRWQGTPLGFYEMVASANLTFQALAPPPPAPEITIQLKRVDGGQRVAISGGTYALGSAVVAQMTSANATVRGASVNGKACAVVQENNSGAVVDLMNDDCGPKAPGAYTLSATALANTGGGTKNESVGFLVVGGGGGGNTTSIPGQAPIVISTFPRRNATGVAVNAFPQLVFSEPVRVRTFVEFTGSGDVPSYVVKGVTATGTVVDLASSPDAPVTSVTVQPARGLKYSTLYRVTLGVGIEDLDGTTLAEPYELAFTTFAPGDVPVTEEDLGSAGLAVLGDRAYVVLNNFTNGKVKGYDISDPINPRALGETYVTWRPVDLAGEETTRIPGVDQRVVVVATGPTNQSKPSNLYGFDVSSDGAPRLFAAASLTSSAIDGFVTRVRVHNGVVYAATHRKGIQIVDLAGGMATLPPPGTAAYTQFVQRFNTDGQGFGQENVQSIGVTVQAAWDPTYRKPAYLVDLNAGQYELDGATQTLIVATGEPGAQLVVIDAQAQQIVSQGGIGTMGWGEALALGIVQTQPAPVRAAVVAGSSTAGGRELVVVSLADPRLPTVIGSVMLPSDITQVTDLVLHDAFALVATKEKTVVVSLANPTSPQIAGILEEAGGRLGLSSDGLLYSNARSIFGGATEGAGIKLTALRRLLAVTVASTPRPILFNENLTTRDAVQVSYRIIPPDSPASTVDVKMLRQETPVDTLTGSFDGVQGESTWPAGRPVQATASYFAQVTADAGTPDELISAKVAVPISDLAVELDKDTNLLVAHTADGQSIIENTYAANGVEPPINRYDYKTSTRTYSKAVATRVYGAVDRPSDYMILRINSGGALVWDESGSETIRVDVPETGKIEVKLRATREIEAMDVKSLTISAEYYPDSTLQTPFRLKTDTIYLANERLHGRLYDATAAVLGRGETAEAQAAELAVGVIPFVGDAAGIAGEVWNVLSPKADDDFSKINRILSVIGIATEFGDVTVVGAALDRGVTILRLGLKQVTRATGYINGLPSRLFELARQRRWADIAEHTQGTVKLAKAGGAGFIDRIVRNADDEVLVNRFMKTYGGAIDSEGFAQTLVRLDARYADPDAIRGAIRSLADFADEGGAAIRLTDNALEGAVKFMKQASNAADEVPASDREQMLKALLTPPEGVARQAHAEQTLRFVTEASSADEIMGLSRVLRETPCQVP